MPLPETIPVRYTEEEAGYVTVRPVVRQTFRLDELLDMILRVSGKDGPRIRQILQAGTVVYHYYRYWWEGFDPGERELAAALARFPDAQPDRPFSAADCALAVFESGGPHPRTLLELGRKEGSVRRLLRRDSFWSRLMAIAAREQPAYECYSYAHRGDQYRLVLTAGTMVPIARAAEAAPAKLRGALRVISGASQVYLVCPRGEAAEAAGSAR